MSSAIAAAPGRPDGESCIGRVRSSGTLPDAAGRRSVQSPDIFPAVLFAPTADLVRRGDAAHAGHARGRPSAPPATPAGAFSPEVTSCGGTHGIAVARGVGTAGGCGWRGWRPGKPRPYSR